MRKIERIPIFIKHINWENLLVNIWKLYGEEDDEVKVIIEDIRKNLSDIKEYWEEYPDLRISQVLVNLEIIPNTMGMWYYKEDEDILVEQGVDPAIVYLWGTYGKTGKAKLKQVTIRHMSTEHIHKCLENVPDISDPYKITMMGELQKRKTSDFIKDIQDVFLCVPLEPVVLGIRSKINDAIDKYTDGK